MKTTSNKVDRTAHKLRPPEVITHPDHSRGVLSRRQEDTRPEKYDTAIERLCSKRDRALDKAFKDFEDALAPARKEFIERKAHARAVYEEATAPARQRLTEEMVKAGQAYENVVAPLRIAHAQKKEKIEKSFNAAWNRIARYYYPRPKAVKT